MAGIRPFYRNPATIPATPATPAAPPAPVPGPSSPAPAPAPANPLGDAEPGNYYASQPYITAQYRPMEGFLRQLMMGRLQNNSLPPEYAAQGLQNINRGYDTSRQLLENQLATAGMYGGGQLSAGFGNLEAGRMGEVAGFQNALPMIQRGMQNEDLAAAAALISAFGRGQGGYSRENQIGGSSSSSSGGGGGSTVLPPMGSPLAGAFGDAASMLASLYGAGMFGGSVKYSTPK